MLTRLWLWIGRLLGRLLLAVTALGLAGWAIAAVHFHLTHRGPVSSEEVIAPSEAGDTQAIIADAIAVVEQHSENTRVLRDAHAKAHGCVRAEVSERADLQPALRQGVFSEPGKTWQAWVRLSNGNAYPQFDRIRDARGMAIKLLDVPGEKLTRDPRHAGEQDFVMFNHPVFFV
ncbi:MAG TPA: catalase, partial [Pseudomonas sp.]|nr:catalase [Pseudomonas sp.]